jgi:hypothetical protein
MKLNAVKLHPKIADYINTHFREDALFDIVDIQQAGKHKFYIIEVSKDDYIYTLKFNESGTLIDNNAELAFPDDIAD